MGFMLRCPSCGVRSYHEFWYGGELRPWSRESSDEDDYRRTWLRQNLPRRQRERWFHFAGCRRWITVERDLRTNEVRDLHDESASSAPTERPL